MSKKNVKNGFTLIEVLIYIGLYSIIMGGAVVAAYAIFESSAHNQTKAMVEEEGNFLAGKIDWALSKAQSASVAGDTLTVVMFDGTIIPISIAGGNMYAGGSGTALNNSNTSVSAIPGVPYFVRTTATADGINPERVVASFRLSSRTSDGFPFSEDFSTAKYLRK